MSARTKVFSLALLLAAAPLAGQDAYRHGYFRVVEQGVTLQRASEPSAETATSNLPFLPGDRVWTDEAGRMEVQFADGSVMRLDSRSKLDYVALESGHRERVVLRLWSGSLFLHVRDGRQSPDFIVETPEGALEPTRRGVYRLDVQAGEARVSVLEGEATVQAAERVRVGGGEQVLVREGEVQGGPERVDGSALDDEFARWDADLERQVEYAEAPRQEYLPEELSPYAGQLAAYGSWRTEPEYGSVWYPHVATGWTPYTHGYWAWTPYGWTWVPNERWGWAAFHYGRWGFNNLGWYWIPGSAWGPGWVSWSAGGSYVGWCPLGWGDRPVYVRHHQHPVHGYAVRRLKGPRTDTAPWTYVRRGDMGRRDLARRKVAPEEVPTGELRVAPAAHVRLSRDLRLVEGAAGGGIVAPQRAVPRVTTRPRPGDTVPELQADPATTIRRPVPRRHRDRGEKADDGAPADESSRGGGTIPPVAVPRPPGGAPVPFLPGGSAIAPSRQRTPGVGEVGTGQPDGGDDSRGREVWRLRPRPAQPSEAPRGEARGHRDREILRPIFGPLSRSRSEESAGRPAPRGDGASSGDGGGARERGRPAGVSSAPRPAAPSAPASAPPASRGEPRPERARAKTRE